MCCTSLFDLADELDDSEKCEAIHDCCSAFTWQRQGGFFFSMFNYTKQHLDAEARRVSDMQTTMTEFAADHSIAVLERRLKKAKAAKLKNRQTAAAAPAAAAAAPAPAAAAAAPTAAAAGNIDGRPAATTKHKTQKAKKNSRSKKKTRRRSPSPPVSVLSSSGSDSGSGDDEKQPPNKRQRVLSDRSEEGVDDDE